MVLQFDCADMDAMFGNDADFVEWYVEEYMKKYLQESYYAISDQGKREMTTNGLDYARRFGFSDYESQGHFVTLMWSVGPDFFEHPGLSEIARRTDLTAMQKVDAFYALPAEVAAEAIMNPNSLYWYPEMLEEAEARDGK